MGAKLDDTDVDRYCKISHTIRTLLPRLDSHDARRLREVYDGVRYGVLMIFRLDGTIYAICMLSAIKNNRLEVIIFVTCLCG